MKMIPIAAVVLTLGMGAAYAADTMSHDAVKAEKERIDADYKAAKDKCDGMKGNAQDICRAEAKAHKDVAIAELDAKNKNTTKAQYDLKVARANADYSVAKQKCQEMKGQDKDACMQRAKAAETKAKADAKAERETAEARREHREAKS